MRTICEDQNPGLNGRYYLRFIFIETLSQHPQEPTSSIADSQPSYTLQKTLRRSPCILHTYSEP